MKQKSNYTGVMCAVALIGCVVSCRPRTSAVSINIYDETIVIDQDSIPAGPTTLYIKNDSESSCRFMITGNGLDYTNDQPLTPAETYQIELTLRSGTYEMYCLDEGNTVEGMRTSLTAVRTQ